MKILYITNVDMSGINGATEHIKGSMLGFRLNGADVEIYDLKRMKSETDMFKLNSKILQIIIFNISAGIHALNSDADAVYIRFAPMILIPAVAARLKRKKVVLEVNGNVDVEVKELFALHATARVIISIFTMFSFLAAERIVTVTNLLAAYYNAKYPTVRGKISVFQNAGYSGLKKREPGYYKKGVFLATRAEWAGMRYAENLQKELIRKGVELEIWNGNKFNGGNYDFGLIVYNANTPVKKYGFSPIKFFTYLSYGIPVIVPDIPEINSLTLKHNAGIVYHDDNSILKSIMLLYSDKNYEDMSENAYQMIQSTYNWEDTSKRMLQWLELI